MKILVIEPGYAPYEKDVDSPEGINSIVGEQACLSLLKDGSAILFQQDGDMYGLPFNRRCPEFQEPIYGPIVICGHDSSDLSFTSLTPIQMENYKKEYHMAEISVRGEGKEMTVMKVKPKLKVRPRKIPKRPER